jgi:hypothetical protein
MGPYGFVEKSFDMEDKFRVPCDTNLINRDRVMYGSVIHANALANLLKSDLQFIDVERSTIFLVFKELLFLVFIYYLLFLNLGKMGTVTILTIGSFGMIYLTLLLMQKGIYLEIGGSLLELLVLEEAFESVEPLLRKFHKWISTKKILTFLTVLVVVLSNPVKGQSIQLAVKKGSVTLNNLTYKQGASLSVSYSTSLNIAPNSVVLARNDQNKVIQLPNGVLSGKNIKPLFKNSQNYNETVINVMFNTKVHAVHQAGITTRGSNRTLQFCPADSSIILQDTLPFFIGIFNPPPNNRIDIFSLTNNDSFFCINGENLVVSQTFSPGLYRWSTKVEIGGVNIAVNNLFIIITPDDKIKLKQKREAFRNSIENFNFETIEILMDEFDRGEHIKIKEEIVLEDD